MEIRVENLNPSTSALQLKQGIAEVLHSPAFGEKIKTNFEAGVWNYFNRNTRRRYYNGTITVPFKEIGERFLEYASSSNIVIQTFRPRFMRSRRDPQETLVNHLRTSAYVDPQVEHDRHRALAELGEPLHITQVELGRLLAGDIFSPEYRWSTPDGALILDGDSRQLVLRQDAVGQSKTISIRLSSITHIYQPSEVSDKSVILVLDRLPRYDEVDRQPSGAFDFGSLLASISDTPMKVPNRRLAALDPQHALVAPFTSTHLHVTFSSAAQLRTFSHRRSKLHMARVRPSSIQIEHLQLYSASSLEKIQTLLAAFDVRVAFQIETLLQNRILDASQILAILPTILVLSYKHEPIQLERILALFISHNIRSTADAYGDGWNEDSEGVGVRPQLLLKTRILLEGPIPDQSNSILRRYARPECFLRVSIRDDDFDKHRHDTETDMRGFLNERYLPIFRDGLEICGRRFEFLGYSSSALRDHSTWFVTPFEGVDEQVVTADKIRTSLGDFSKVAYIPARWMARIAQAFTATLPTVSLRREEIKRTEDVEMSGSCFTDGVGTISATLANEIDILLAGQLSPYDRRRRVRIGGAKGMLSLDPLLPGRCICIRPSMEKFISPDGLTLDIAGTFTRPLPAYLNRPLIKILEDLGIDAKVLLELQFQAIIVVEKARDSCFGAARLLDSISLGSSARLPATLRRLKEMLSLDLKKSLYADQFKDAFLKQALHVVAVQALRTLKYNARIPLPGCWTLVGIADEDGFLEEGEIYVCIARRGEQNLYLSGDICISRSPTIHPGDVRVVRAVGRLSPDVAPRVSCHVNCVVFSVKGTRSLPSCLGGGDLDGDLYTLITNPDLIPSRDAIVDPGAYEAPPMVKLTRPCTIEDGAKFVFEYILNDLMGVVASRHLQIADQELSGSKCDSCLLLANLHSDAVDFSKTGRPVDFRSLPKLSSRLKPDFMWPEWKAGKPGEHFYESPKVLGRLFRSVPSEESFSSPGYVRSPSRESIDTGRAITNALAALPIDGLPFGNLGPPDEVLVREFRNGTIPEFGDELLRRARANTLSRRHGFHLSEEEVFVGTILAPSKDKRGKRDTIARLQEHTADLFARLRQEIAGDEEGDVALQAERAWAAWHAALRSNQEEYGVKTFAWIVLGVLLDNVAELNGEK
ncbi:hypothetical protein MNV49_005108 [Pseudohyphozyma bogoriensis]|nr:hypothetical protein MNV49_005108 [Pseudohyphozyma bogoriensis]